MPQITAPVLYIAAEKDELCPPQLIEKAKGLCQSPASRVVHVDCSHFEIYAGQPFKEASEAMIQHFTSHL